MSLIEKISQKMPLILYSGPKVKHEDGAEHINLNFLYLTRLDIPNLILFIYKKNVLVFTNNTKDIILVRKMLGEKKYKFYKFQDIYKFDFSKYNNILTLHNFKDIINHSKFNYQKLDTICLENRVIKTEEEIENIRISCVLVSQAIQKMYQDLKKKKIKKTKDIVQHISSKLKKKGIVNVSYSPICSIEYNSTILHYDKYDSILKKKSLVLLDIGFKYKGYCSDITRTFPVSGKLSLNQKKIYNIVLKVSDAMIKKLKPNVSWNELESECYLIIFRELEKIKLIIPNTLTISEKIEFILENLMYHSLGHFIGLKNHDVGKLDVLKKGMVLTIEPGIYFPKKLLLNKLINQKEVQKYMSIGGIRIEDTILITQKSYDILNKVSAKKVLEKDPKKIEKIILS